MQKIADSMQTSRGYDSTFPIIITKDVPGILNGTMVDGHSRLLAAKLVNIQKLAYIEKTFDDRADIISFIYRTQLSRRSLTEQEQYTYYQKMAGLKKENGKQLKTDQQIADELEISRRQISKFKEVERKSDPATLESFKAGKISLNAAYQKMKTKDKTKKLCKKTYEDGYAAGIEYAIQELSKGREANEILAELTHEAAHEQKSAE